MPRRQSYDNYDSDHEADDDGSDEEVEPESQDGSGEEEEPVHSKKRRTTASDADVPLFQRLSELESSSVEMASSTSARGSNGSVRKRLKQERKAASLKAAQEREASERKKSKNAPAELRSNRPVRRLREIPGAAPPPKHSDPRFSDLHGKLSHNSFFNGYKFLDGYQEDEIKKLQKASKKAKSDSTRELLTSELGKRKQEMLERRRALRIKERLGEIKSEERRKVAAGKKPFFLKESAKKTVAMEQRFDELKAAGHGKLKKFIEKKRAKNASKDRRWLPGSRREEDDG